MDPRLNVEMSQQRQIELRRRARTRWPDDGLPPRHSKGGERSLHPAAVLASLFSRD